MTQVNEITLYQSFPDRSSVTKQNTRSITLQHQAGGAGYDLFDYDDGTTTSTNIIYVSFEVTDGSSEPTLVLEWSSATDPGNSFLQSDGVRKVTDAVNKKDTFTFAIPPWKGHPDLHWSLKQGTPGYRLHVKVRLKTT